MSALALRSSGRSSSPSICLLTLIFAVAGCDADPATDPVIVPIPDVDGSVPDMAPDAMPDMAPDAMPDAMPDAGCTVDCPAVEWAEGPSLGRVSDHHTTLVRAEAEGAALYVVGGIATDARGGIAELFDQVQRAGLDADGMPAAFEEHLRLPFPLAFHGQAIDGDRVYLAGGVRPGGQGPAVNPEVVMLVMGADGIDEVVVCPETLPVPPVHPTVELIDGSLYVIGGTRQAPVDGVFVAAIGPDGCPGPFAASATLPAARSHHASAVIDGRVVVMGGFGEGQAPRTDTLRSTHGPDGDITGWAVVGTLEPAPWTASAVVDGDAVWLIGGGEGSGFGARFVDTVRRAPIVDGVPGDFEAMDAPLPIARSHVHQTPLFGGRIYTVGGRIFQADGTSMTSTDRTFVGRLLDRPDGR